MVELEWAATGHPATSYEACGCSRRRNIIGATRQWPSELRHEVGAASAF
jgi:hypothetical protein